MFVEVYSPLRVFITNDRICTARKNEFRGISARTTCIRKIRGGFAFLQVENHSVFFRPKGLEVKKKAPPRVVYFRPVPSVLEKRRF